MGPDSLASRIIAGEETAFEEFRLRFGSRFFTYFRQHGLSDMDAADLAGDCVTDIPLKVRDHFPPDHTNFDAWVYTLRTRALQNWLRRKYPEMVEIDKITPAEMPHSFTEKLSDEATNEQCAATAHVRALER